MRAGDPPLILAMSPAATPSMARGPTVHSASSTGPFVTGSREAPGLPHFKQLTVPPE